jgi:hypothetical protein
MLSCPTTNAREAGRQKRAHALQLIGASRKTTNVADGDFSRFPSLQWQKALGQSEPNRSRL